MISTRQLYEGMLEAYDDEKDYLLPTKTTQIVVEFDQVKKICEGPLGEKMRKELEEESNPWGLDYGSFESSDLDNDVSDQVQDLFGYIFSDEWEDCE